MKRIPLTQGKYALVDDADYEWLSQWKWCAHKKHRSFYAMRGTEKNGIKRTIPMHREILKLKHGDGFIVDHINGNGLDNRRKNLRKCKHRDNLRNQRKRESVKTSKYKGVSWAVHANKWRSQIRTGKKSIHIGYFDSEVEAAKAYDKKAKELFGKYANVNFQETNHECKTT